MLGIGHSQLSTVGNNMGRKSSLTEEQWLEVERRHVLEGESINSLAAAFGVNESSIRRRIKPKEAEAPAPENPLKKLAADKVRADAESRRVMEQIAELPYGKQAIVENLAKKLASVSEHLASAAEQNAASAHRLSLLANQQLDLVDDVDPLKSLRALQGVALLTKLANSSSEIGLNLLRANKDSLQTDDEPPTPVAITFETKDARKHEHDPTDA